MPVIDISGLLGSKTEYLLKSPNAKQSVKINFTCRDQTLLIVSGSTVTTTPPCYVTCNCIIPAALLIPATFLFYQLTEELEHSAGLPFAKKPCLF